MTGDSKAPSLFVREPDCISLTSGEILLVKSEDCYNCTVVLFVDEVLYMNVQKNKYAYIVRDSRGIMLYSDERNLYTKLYKGLKITPLES